MFKKVTFYKEIFAANIRLAKGESEYYGDYFEGIPLVVNNDAVMSLGGVLAGVGRDALGRPTICVSKDFLELPTTTARFIILHEFGHAHLGHVPEQSLKNYFKSLTRSTTRTLRATFGILDEHELAADKFAAERMPSIDDCIEAIEYIKEYSIKVFGKGMHIREMNLRIKALQAMKENN